MASPRRKRVGVVGAGVSGLAALKQCLDAGLEPTAFERHSRLGGVWVFDEKLREGQGSAIYDSLITNSSKELMCFSDFPFDPTDPPYLPHQKVLRYYQRYAERHNLKDYIRFDTRVLSVEQVPAPVSDDDGCRHVWRIKTAKTTQEEEEEDEEHTFDFVLLCSGTYAKPFIPDYPGLSWFSGRVLHSNEFRRGADFSGAGVVVVVGASNSAGDVAVDVSQAADEVLLSVKTGTWVLGRQGPSSTPIDMIAQTRFVQTWLPDVVRSTLGGRIADGKLGHRNLGLKSTRPLFKGNTMINDEIGMRILAGKVKAKPNIARFTKNGIEFEDGTKTEKVDAVIFATGYIPTWSYMDQSLVPSGYENMDLYEHVFPPKLGRNPTLAVIGGISCLGAHGPVFELQCRWATRVFTRKTRLPPPDVMAVSVQRQKERLRTMYGKLKYLLPSVAYMEKLADHVGCRPNLGRLLLSDPALAIKVLFGPCLPPTYRLTGPNPWTGARDAIFAASANTSTPTMTRRLEAPDDRRIQKRVQCHGPMTPEEAFVSKFASKFIAELEYNFYILVARAVVAFGVFVCLFKMFI